jgi:omega-amidase
MDIAIVQFNIAWKDKQTNFTKIEELLAGKQADLVVLPEMFQTGFCTDDPTIAETMEGESIVWMQKFSKELSIIDSLWQAKEK